MHQLVVLNAHIAVIYIRADVLAVIGALIKRQPRFMGLGPRFLQYLRGQHIVVGLHKRGDITQAVFVVVAHSGGQPVHAHFLAQIAGIVAVHYNGLGVCGLYLGKPHFVLRVQIVAHIQMKRFPVP